MVAHAARSSSILADAFPFQFFRDWVRARERGGRDWVRARERAERLGPEKIEVTGFLSMG
jgi:hypothetical protein